MTVRKGPFYSYSPYAMPDPLAIAFFKEFGGGDTIKWIVAGPGGPFNEPPENYNEHNFSQSSLQLNAQIDAWLLANGATAGETVLLLWP